MARDPRCFTYLSDAAVPVRVVLGDGRLSLAREPDSSFDLIMVDAFNSDAIPVHLLTREAVGLYLRKIAPGGSIVFHLTNRHLSLSPVVARLAESHLLSVRARRQGGELEAETGGLASPSIWTVMAPTPAALGSIFTDRNWGLPVAPPGFRIWTDDYSSIFSVFVR